MSLFSFLPYRAHYHTALSPLLSATLGATTMSMSMTDEEERMSPDLGASMDADPLHHHPSHSPSPEEPRDLSVKRKVGLPAGKGVGGNGFKNGEERGIGKEGLGIGMPGVLVIREIIIVVIKKKKKKNCFDKIH